MINKDFNSSLEYIKFLFGRGSFYSLSNKSFVILKETYQPSRISIYTAKYSDVIHVSFYNSISSENQDYKFINVFKTYEL